MRRHRDAEDFTAEVLEAYRAIVRRATAMHGEPRLSFGPIWMGTDHGDVRRVSSVWFLPKNTGLRVDEANHSLGQNRPMARRWTLEAWNHGGPISHVEVSFYRTPDEGDMAEVARMIGLLPPVVEVTRFGDTERQYMPGLDEEVSARCSGWPNGSWHGPDCGNREEHAPHRY